MYRLGFILEQALGHITHAQNLQAIVPQDATIAARWGLPTWQTSGPLSRLPLIRSNWTLQAGWQARRLVRRMAHQEGLDGLFFHTQVTAVLAQNWVRRIPSAVSLDATPRQYDSLGPYYAHQAGPAWLEAGKLALNRRLFRQARRIVTWSEWARQGLVEEYEVTPEKVTVIPPGVAVEAWRPPAARPPAGGVVKILFVGGDLARKGGQELLAAFRQLRDEQANAAWPALELHLVTRSRVEEEAGLFVYNEMQANSDPLKQLYFASDIFCLPTLGDCLPMVLSEAGAAGLPAVTTRLAAIPEIVDDGRTGFLTPAGDIRALVEALRRLILDPELRRQQGEAAQQFISAQFDATKNVTRLLDLLKGMVDEARGEKRLR